jgi:hypothetical protein
LQSENRTWSEWWRDLPRLLQYLLLGVVGASAALLLVAIGSEIVHVRGAHDVSVAAAGYCAIAIIILAVNRYGRPKQATSDILVGAPVEMALEWSRIALESIAPDQAAEVDGTTGTVATRAPLTWRSLGETVTAAVSPNDASSSIVHVMSRSQAVSLVDYGKNRRNVDAVITMLRRVEAARRSDN